MTCADEFIDKSGFLKSFPITRIERTVIMIDLFVDGLVFTSTSKKPLKVADCTLIKNLELFFVTRLLFILLILHMFTTTHAARFMKA